MGVTEILESKMSTKDKILITTMFVCLITATVLALIIIAAKITEEPVGTEAQYLPTIAEVQRQIQDMGYDIEVDGRLGPKTEEAWDRACADQIMLEMLKKGGMK